MIDDGARNVERARDADDAIAFGDEHAMDTVGSINFDNQPDTPVPAVRTRCVRRVWMMRRWPSPSRSACATGCPVNLRTVGASPRDVVGKGACRQFGDDTQVVRSLDTTKAP